MVSFFYIDKLLVFICRAYDNRFDVLCLAWNFLPKVQRRSNGGGVLAIKMANSDSVYIVFVSLDKLLIFWAHSDSRTLSLSLSLCVGGGSI